MTHRFLSLVLDTDEELITSVNSTGGKFIASVLDTSDKNVESISVSLFL